MTSQNAVMAVEIAIRRMCMTIFFLANRLQPVSKFPF